MASAMYFGGLEGGATHSNLVICNGSGEVVGRARGPGTNHWHIGIEECVNRILTMLHQAKSEAGIPVDQPLDALGLTMSGCEQDSTNRELEVRVREKDENSAREVHAASDTVGSLFTGAPDCGIVLIAGTGSNALLRTADGQQFGCGGWGHLLGDEGAAYWIAQKAVKAVFDDMDGLNPPPHPTARVWALVQQHFNVDSRNDLLQHAYANFEKSKFAALTGKLASLATEDQLARWLFKEAGRALADHVAALTARIPPTSVPGRPMRVVCVGSVWNSWRLLQPGFLQQLKRRGVNMELELVRLRVSSALGAAGLAGKMVGYDLPRDDSAYCNVFYTYHPSDRNDDIANGNGSNDVSNGSNYVSNGSNDVSNGSNDISNESNSDNNDNIGFSNGTHTDDLTASKGCVNGKLSGKLNAEDALVH